MATKRATSKRKPTPEPRSALGQGLMAGTIELRSKRSLRIRLMDGQVVAATCHPDVTPELLRDCQRHGRTVIVTDSEAGPIVLGALMTAPAVQSDAEGNLVMTGKKIRLKADTELSFEVGDALLKLQENGVVKLRGDRMTIDVGSLVKFLSARVEFP